MGFELAIPKLAPQKMVCIVH